MKMGFAIDLAQQRSGLHAHRPQLWINANAVHRRQIDDDTIVAQGSAGDIVTAAFNCDEKIVRARKLHRVNNVRHSRTARDQTGMLIDARIQMRRAEV
jgi:hypothetical protein